jgi:ribosomal protein S27AE
MLSRLPVQEPSVFTGDPLCYPAWKSAFSLLIERKNIPDSEKILYIQRYVSGKALEAVKGLFLVKDGSAYRQALQILETRFGHPFVVAQAFRSKLDSWPTLKSKDCLSLQSFSDFLQQCCVAKSEVGGLNVLDDTSYLKNLTGKLPERMRLRWAREVVEKKRRTQKYPTFEDLSLFVQRESEIANEPVFGAGGAELSSGVSQYVKPALSGNKASFSVQLDHSEEDCIFCQKSGHSILVCKDFKSRTIDERKKFVMSKGLCFACAKGGHMARSCKNRALCGKCGGKHPECLHDDNFKPRNLSHDFICLR